MDADEFRDHLDQLTMDITKGRSYEISDLNVQEIHVQTYVIDDAPVLRIEFIYFPPYGIFKGWYEWGIRTAWWYQRHTRLTEIKADGSTVVHMPTKREMKRPRFQRKKPK